jgi:HlyD family secretion protein
MASQAVSELQAFRALESRSSKKRKKKRITLAVALVLALAVGAGAWFAIPVLLAPPVLETAPITDVVVRGTFEDVITSNGSLAAAEQVTITPEVTGTVLEIRVNEGDTVEKGQLLFIIENKDLDSQVDAAQRTLNSAYLGSDMAVQARDDARRMAGNAWQSYQDLKAQVEAARGEAAAKGEAFDEASAKRELDAALQAAQAADSATVSAQQQIDSALLQVEEAQANLEKAKALLDKRSVFAPISGQVIAQNIERGMDLKTLAESGKSPLQIVDRSKMSVTLNVNEADILKLSVGQEASVTFAALPEYTATATVTRIAPLASGNGSGGSGGAIGSGGGGSVVSYPVELTIEQPDPRLKIGMTASAQIAVKQIKNVLLVNSLAIQYQGFDTVVFVLDAKGEASPVVISVIEDNGNIAAVEGAIKEGDTIVLSNMGGPVAGGQKEGAAVVTISR